VSISMAGADRTDGWVVRHVTGSATKRSYRCPGCDHEIRPATPHVVAWPDLGGVDDDVNRDGRDGEDAGLADRRHWHTACWNARGRRGPKVQRSRNAPRY
jgi:hypothetical protein